MSVGRPAPVVAHLRRPFLWLPVVAAFLALVLGVGVLTADRETRRRDRSVHVDGTLLVRRTGDGMAKVRYVHPVTEQELTVTIPVWDRDRLPAGPGPVALDADPDDPGGVRLDGDVVPATSEVGWNLPYLALPVLVWGRRRWGVWRTQRIMAGGGPTFAMLGAIAPLGSGRRTELHLWPLDAAPGSPSLCRVALLATSHLPLATVFDVEVKGRPRPFGWVVARSSATGGVLWPAGAALPRNPRPRPAATAVPAGLPAELEVSPKVAAVRPPWALLAAGALAVAVGGLLLATVTFVTTRGAGQARRVEEGARVVAEVTAHDDRERRLALAYTAEGATRTGWATVQDARQFPVGRRYPAFVDPHDPTRLRLAAARYDRVIPLLWGALPLLAGLVLVGRAGGRWALALRLARRGGWRHFEMWTGMQSTTWATFAPPLAGHAICSAQLGLPGLAGPPLSPRAITALVAGDPQPGGRMVVHFQGRTETVRRVGAAPRLRWWPT